MNRNTTRIAILAFLLAFLVTSGVFAYVISEESKISNENLKKLAGNKLFEISGVSVATDDGTLFIIGRDKETRNWEWYSIDPLKKKLLKTGKCPFVGTWAYKISSDANHAFAVSHFKTALYHLNTANDKWNMIYKNPNMGVAGYAFRFFSKISFLDNSSFVSMLEFWNKQHQAMDTIITFFDEKTEKPEKVASLNILREQTAKMAGIDKAKTIYVNDSFVYGSDKSILFVLRTNSRKSRQHSGDFLFLLNSKKELKILDKSEGMIFPLQNDSKTGKILYSISSKKEKALILLENGTKKTLAADSFEIGTIRKDGFMLLAKIEGKKNLTVYLGKPGEKPEKGKSFETPYGIHFLQNSNHFIVISEESVNCYKIEDRK